jgi:hypothetical protein
MLISLGALSVFLEISFLAQPAPYLSCFRKHTHSLEASSYA